MKLIDFLTQCKKIIDKNPNALQMEMFSYHSASGAIDELSYPSISKISSRGDDEELFKEMLPKDYSYDDVITVSIGN